MKELYPKLKNLESLKWPELEIQTFGIDSYKKISNIGAPTFEDVRDEFKKLCGSN